MVTNTMFSGLAVVSILGISMLPMGLASAGEPGAGDRSPPPEAAGDAAKTTVNLTVEVKEKGREGRLERSWIQIRELLGADRSGRIVWESGGGGAGRFEAPLHPGRYQVHAQCQRFRGEKREVILMAGSPQTVVFRLEEGQSIAGHVRSPSGEPIAGASVVAFEEIQIEGGTSMTEDFAKLTDLPRNSVAVAARTVSGMDGSFQLDGLDRKYYTVRAIAPLWSPGSVDRVPAPRIRVHIVLRQGSAIVGTVTDSSGAPIGGATISAYPVVGGRDVENMKHNMMALILEIARLSRPPVDTLTSDSRGSFRFETLGSGVCDFLVEAAGHQRGRFMKRRVGPDTRPLDFILKRGLVIRGVVRDSGGHPVRGAMVRAGLIQKAAESRTKTKITFNDGSVVTDEQGRFVLDTLEEGTYAIICWHETYESLYRRDIRPTGEEMLLELSTGATLRGRVVDRITRKPIPGAVVAASDLADIQRTSFSQGDGSFVLRGLKVGRQVTIRADGYAQLRQDLRPADLEAECTFELEHLGSVAGRVVNQAGEPIPGARVVARRSTAPKGVEGTLSSGLTDAEGRFRLADVEAGPNTTVLATKSDYLGASTDAFKVEPSGQVDLPPIVLRSGGAVTGTVTDPEGEPIPACAVSLLGEGETESTRKKPMPTRTTGKKGEYRVAGLKAGTFSLLFKAKGFFDRRVDGVRLGDDGETTVDVRLERSGTLRGTIVDAQGAPIPGAEVVAKDSGGELRELKAESGKDGRFEIEGIKARDSVEVSARRNGYEPSSEQKIAVGAADIRIVLKGAKVSPRAPALAKKRLAPADSATLEGKVLDPDGRGIRGAKVVARPSSSPAGSVQREQPAATTGEGGAFSLTGLRPGTYDLVVTAPGFSMTILPGLTIAPREEPKDVTVILNPLD